MAGIGNRVGIRNKLPADRERRAPEYDYSDAGYDYMVSGLSQMIIGRFLVSKSMARRPEKADNPLLDVRKNLAEMNRSRGVALDVGSILLTYETPQDFQERVICSASTDKEFKRLTPKGLKQHVNEVKKRISSTFNSQAQASSIPQFVEDDMRIEQREKRLYEIASREKMPIYGSLTHDEWVEEYEDIEVELEATVQSGFKFTRNLHFVDDLVGVKVRERDDSTGALMQKDVDRINDAYRINGLLTDEFPPIRLEETPKFIPLFQLTISPEQAEERIYRPFITTQRVPFQELGIHRI